MTFTHMILCNCKKHFLIVYAVSNLFDKVNLAMFWSLSAEILRPSKILPNRISSSTLWRILCAFSNFQALVIPLFFWEAGYQLFQNLKIFILEPFQLGSRHSKCSGLHVPLSDSKVATWDSISFSLEYSTRDLLCSGLPRLSVDTFLFICFICPDARI